jgi:ribosomal protein S12 methylthiotransferase
VNQHKQKFNIISLGCARNLVDSEVMSGLLEQHQYQIVSEAADADIVLINTCGFIEAAKAESLDTILEVSRLKEEGRLRKLIVAGCLSQRYPQELAAELPEVDLFIGTGEVPRIVDILKEHEHDQTRRHYVDLPQYLYDHLTPRIRSTPSYTAFLKVSEGCDHKCAFCIIPKLRGPHRSRSIDSVIKEAALLAEAGVKEINLIAQDLTAYGRDRKDGTTLYRLLTELEQVDGLVWIRLLYAYPNYLEAPLLELIDQSEKVCKYVDIPLQHVSAAILGRMRRGKSGSAVEAAVQRLRESISDLVLRTSLIVGFPGETEKDFQALLDFVERSRFERLGVFKYSIEEGTSAATLADHIDDDEKERRWQEVMDLQASISRAKNEALIGSIQHVMIDGVDDTGQLIGRTQGHAPEVDGAVYLQNIPTSTANAPKAGDFADVKITQALEYDLIGELQNV